MARRIAAEGPLQDSPLDRVGVLEFIDQGSAVARRHGAEQRRVALLAGIQLLQQLAVAHLAAALPPARQFGPAPVGEVEQQQLRWPIHQSGDRLQQFGLGQAGAIGVGGALQFLHRAGMEVVAQLLHLQQLGVAGRALQADQPAGHGVEPVGLGLEAVRPVVVADRLGGTGAGGQVVLQGLGIALPQRVEALPARQPAGLQLIGQGLVAHHPLRQGIEFQGRVAVESLQHAGQPVGIDPATEQAGQVLAGQGQHLLLPVVVHDLTPALGGAVLQRHSRPEARLERLTLQGAAAEAVDGGDVGTIELLQGQQQPAAQQRRGGWALGRQPPGQGFIQIGGQRRIAGAGGGFQQGQGLLQAAGDAVAQFGGRGVGEGNHQQLFDRQRPRPLAHQPQHQMGQGEGLARAGAGFQQPDARAERHAIGLKGRQGHDVHPFSSCLSSSSGP